MEIFSLISWSCVNPGNYNDLRHQAAVAVFLLTQNCKHRKYNNTLNKNKEEIIAMVANLALFIKVITKLEFETKKCFISNYFNKMFIKVTHPKVGRVRRVTAIYIITSNTSNGDLNGDLNAVFYTGMCTCAYIIVTASAASCQKIRHKNSRAAPSCSSRKYRRFIVSSE